MIWVGDGDEPKEAPLALAHVQISFHEAEDVVDREDLRDPSDVVLVKKRVVPGLEIFDQVAESLGLLGARERQRGLQMTDDTLQLRRSDPGRCLAVTRAIHLFDEPTVALDDAAIELERVMKVCEISAGDPLVVSRGAGRNRIPAVVGRLVYDHGHDVRIEQGGEELGGRRNA